jgi:hypothetical protein
MRTRHFRSRRGISAVVGAILLAGTTVLGISLVAWAHSTVTKTESVLASSSSTMSNKISEYLTIENIWFCNGVASTCHYRDLGGNHHGINITIADYGNIGFNVTQIQFNTTQYLNKTNVGLLPGKEFSWAQYYPWQSGKTQTIVITTARGSIYTTQVIPP